jgi:hypothetical protein
MQIATNKEKMISLGLIVFAGALLLLGANILAVLALLASIGFGIYGMLRPFKPGTNNPFDLQAKLGVLGLILFVIGSILDLIF